MKKQRKQRSNRNDYQDERRRKLRLKPVRKIKYKKHLWSRDEEE